jgi:hypothetical protein
MIPLLVVCLHLWRTSIKKWGLAVEPNEALCPLFMSSKDFQNGIDSFGGKIGETTSVETKGSRKRGISKLHV